MRSGCRWLFGRCLEPTFRPCDSGGVDAIGGAELGDGFGEIVADGALGEAQLGGDFAGGAAFAGALQDLAFAVGEGVGLGGPGLGGEAGIDDAEALRGRGGRRRRARRPGGL